MKDPTKMTEAEMDAELGLKDPNKMSEEEMDAELGLVKKPSMSQGEAAFEGLKTGLSVGLKPLAEGIGAGLGTLYGQLTSDQPFSLEEAGQNLNTARNEAIARDEQAFKEYPLTNVATSIIGGIPSAGLATIGTLGQAAKVGLGYGALNAAGSAQSLPEAAIMTAAGPILGMGAYGAGKAIEKVAPVVVKGAREKIIDPIIKKMGYATTGVPEEVIGHFQKKSSDILKMNKKYAEDVSEAADIAKQQTNSEIDSFKKILSDQIDNTLAENKNETISVKPLLDKLKSYNKDINPVLNIEDANAYREIQKRILDLTDYKVLDNELFNLKEMEKQLNNELSKFKINRDEIRNKNKLLDANLNNPDLYLEPYTRNQLLKEKTALMESTKPYFEKKIQLKEVEDAIKMIKELKQNPLVQTVNAKDFFDIVKYLQDEAANSYYKSGEVIKSRVPYFVRAANHAAAFARIELRKLVPGIKKSMDDYFLLHQIKNKMNINLLKEGKSYNSLLTAGAGTNKTNAKVLRKIDEITGSDITEKSKDIAAMQYFGNADFLPVEGTGKSPGRMLFANSMAQIAASVFPNDSDYNLLNPIRLLGLAMSAPWVLKGYLRTTNLSRKIQDKALSAALKLMSHPQGRSLISQEAQRQGINLLRVRQRLENAKQYTNQQEKK